MHRTARNLAVDHLRRRNVRDWVEFADETIGSTPDPDPDARLAAREALDRLTPHERLLILLRFEAGLSLAEIGGAAGHLRGRGAQARRPRAGVAGRRAQGRYPARAPAGAGAGRPLARTRCLTSAGSRRPAGRPACWTATASSARSPPPTRWCCPGRTDIHPALYGQEPVAAQGQIDLDVDRRDLAALRAALLQDVPLIGICRGHQLLNIAFGGTLHQDVGGHDAATHPFDTAPARSPAACSGAASEVCSQHHQSVRPRRPRAAGHVDVERRRGRVRRGAPAAASRSASSGTPRTRRAARAAGRLAEAFVKAAA